MFKGFLVFTFLLKPFSSFFTFFTKLLFFTFFDWTLDETFFIFTFLTKTFIEILFLLFGRNFFIFGKTFYLAKFHFANSIWQSFIWRNSFDQTFFFDWTFFFLQNFFFLLAKHFIWRNFIWQTPFGEVSFGELHLTKLCLVNLHLAWIGCANPFPGFARFSTRYANFWLNPKMTSQTNTHARKHANKRGEILYRRCTLRTVYFGLLHKLEYGTYICIYAGRSKDNKTQLLIFWQKGLNRKWYLEINNRQKYMKTYIIIHIYKYKIFQIDSKIFK